MPLMMDDDMDLDLFGEALGLSARPPSRQLHERLDELRTNGCAQGIAWSKSGCIASIAADGAALELRNLRCHPDDGTWALSEATVRPSFFKTTEGGPLKHLSWSPTGNDLAAIDAAGHVTIITIYSSLNKPSLSYLAQGEASDDLHSVVGSFWLNVAAYPANRPTVLHGPAIKHGADYRYEASQAPVLGPCHPHPAKSAFIYLTTNGSLRLLYPQNTGKWHEFVLELESIVSSDDLITHAAICPDKSNTLFIAFATASKQLHTLRAIIDWGQTRVDKNPTQAIVQPTIKTKHLAVTSWLQEGPGVPINASHLESSMSQLTRLDFLPSGGDTTGKIATPTIVTYRSHLPISPSHYNQEVYTTIDLFEVRDRTQTIHPAFEQLSSRRNSTSSAPTPIMYLKKRVGFTVNKIIVAVDSMNNGKVICFAYSDGSVEYRDRMNMTENFNDGNLERVWHLSQIGFTYPEGEQYLQVAFSPSFCSLVYLNNESKMHWQHLDYRLGPLGENTEDPMYGAALAAIALSCAGAALRQLNYDDILATASKHADAQFTYLLLTDICRIFKVQADYSEEQHHETLVRNTSIQICLSIQNSLGFKGEFHNRTFSGKLAWVALQLRNIVMIMTMAANANVPLPTTSGEKPSLLEDPEIVSALAGSVRWTLDLMAWIIDSLLTLPTTIPSTVTLTNASTLSLPDLLAHLYTTNSVALHMILSSTIRGFIIAICRRVQHIEYVAHRAINIPRTQNQNQGGNANQSPHPNSNLSPALRQAYTNIYNMTTTSIVRIKTIETLLSSLSTLIKQAYSTSPSSSQPPTNTPQSQPNSQQQPAQNAPRNVLEIKMLFGGAFPEAFKSVISELFRKENGLLATVEGELEPADLFFKDFVGLEVDEDGGSLRRRREGGRVMDVFRKVWLVRPTAGSGGGNGGIGADGKTVQQRWWRRCNRCAAVMEDIPAPRQALGYLLMQQRRCGCSGYWNTLSPDKAVA